MSQTVLIADLDNTIYDFAAFFVPSFNAMVDALANRMRLDRTLLVEEFRAVYARHGSIEYSFATQELPSTVGRSPSEIEELIDLAKTSFCEVRDASLKPYPTVSQTLRVLHHSDVRIIGVTNAPWFLATRRLKHLGVDIYFDGLGAFEGTSMESLPSTYKIVERIKERSRAGGYPSPISTIWRLTARELKPNSAAYERVLRDISFDPSRLYVIGDSINKDLAPARRFGAQTIWARYGTHISEDHMNTLLALTPWSKRTIKATYAQSAPIGGSAKPDFLVDSFDQLIPILTNKFDHRRPRQSSAR